MQIRSEEYDDEDKRKISAMGKKLIGGNGGSDSRDNFKL